MPLSTIQHELPQEIFVSHSSVDKEFTAKLVAMLRRHGLPCWQSESNILGAQQWHDEIGAALNRCDWFILILSPDSVESMWVKRELLFALEENRFANKILPVLWLPCDQARLSWVLPSVQAVDFQTSFDDGSRDILRTWGIGYKSS